MFNLHQKRRAELKRKLRARERVFAGWMSYPETSIAETFARAGFDFIAIDMEHTCISLEQARLIITACQGEGTSCLPRPVSHSNDVIKPLLEAGADGVIAQMVDNQDEAKQLLTQLKFPPAGKRSFGVNRAHGYGFDFDEYVATWNESSIFMIQVESVAGLENIDRMLSLDQVDGAMIGPYDLSGSLGIPGQIDHPKVQEATQHVIAACAAHGKACATQISEVSSKRVATLLEEGYTCIILGSDLFILWKWAEEARALIQDLKNR